MTLPCRSRTYASESPRMTLPPTPPPPPPLYPLRLPPVDLTNVDDDFAQVLERTLRGADGRPINIFGTLAHHPGLLERFNRFGGYLLNRGLVPAREREVVILRVGWNCGSVYEFGQHTIIGKREGLSDAEIRALTKPAAEHGWSDRDLILIALADDLCTNNVASDETWTALRSQWSDAQLVELVVVGGFYRLVSGFLNTMGVQLDEGVPTWPTTG